jgi:hypothetical protein
MPADETVITLDSGVWRSSGISNEVSRNGPTTLVAAVTSTPSSVRR